MSNLDEWQTYKEPLKHFILEFTRDSEYYKAKCKVGSLQHTCGGNLALTETWVNVRWGAHSRLHSEMVMKYGDALVDRFVNPDCVD